MFSSSVSSKLALSSGPTTGIVTQLTHTHIPAEGYIKKSGVSLSMCLCALDKTHMSGVVLT